MFYPQEVIDQVIGSNSIVDVISEYVKLNKKGSAYFGLCPFHNEKTPSFSVTDNGDRKMFYCFGCHTGGNVLTFLMKYENYSYSEALKVLADRAGITLPKPDYSQADSEKYKLKEQVLQIYREAAIYYYHLLRSERGKQAYAYLKNRQLSDDIIRQFGLGYSDKYRDDLYKYIRSKGFSDDVMKETRLFSIKETDVHDYFWNRVMFPIMDVRGRVIAFGGRVMGDGEPKYLNSPENIVFNKSSNLFGLNIARRYKGKELILCEGYMDVISLHQAGFSNAVASLGTALTSGHVSVLKRYTSNVIISYDSDSAGRDAAIRAIPKLREMGINTKVVNLLPYKDPDELIKAEGSEAYRQRLKEARNSLLFEMDVLKESFDMNDPDSKTNFYNEAARKLSYLDDEMERDNYLQAVSREFGIDYRMLKNKVKQYALSRDGSKGYTSLRTEMSSRSKDNTALSESCKTVLAYLADNPSFYQKIRGIIGAGDFYTEPYRQIAGLLFDQLESGKVNVSGIIGSFGEADDQEKAAEVFCDVKWPEQSDDIRRMINESIINIRKNAIEETIRQESDITKVLDLRKEQEKLMGLDVFGG